MKHDILNKVISLIVPEVSLILAQSYLLLDGPGVSFTDGIVCPQASQTCCDSCSHSSSHPAEEVESYQSQVEGKEADGKPVKAKLGKSKGVGEILLNSIKLAQTFCFKQILDDVLQMEKPCSRTKTRWMVA